MTFGRKIANRILLAYLAPLGFMLILGIVFVSANSHRINLLRYSLGQLVVLVTALLVGRLFTRPFAARLAQLLRAAERMEQGDYGARLDVGRGDGEFADLARAFNHMADVMAARESALREQNQVLAALNHRMESVLNATNDGIAMLNREGRFALVNRRFGDMLGARPEDLLHQSIEEAQPHLVERLAQPDRLMKRFGALTLDDLRDPIGVAEEVVELSGPERRFVQVFTAPVQGEDGLEVIGRIIALRDVTRERELDKMKTDFISVVSHELRTPLTSIKGYTDVLLSGAAGDLSELQHEFLGTIQSSTTRLTNLINDILDISRIESGRIEIKHEPIDYRLIVTDVLRMIQGAADEKQIHMEAHLPASIPPVRGDTDKVTQVLTNLVSNAVKYTPRGGAVHVMLELNENASVTTCVSDTGIGIGLEDQKKLFQRFFRADNSSTREAGGTGLGLVIAKTIVELLGGAIWLDSEVGRGSRFYFTLPVYLESDDARPPQAVPLPDRGIGLVMVVDDDTYLRGLIEHHLHRRGYGVLGAGGSAEALQKARLHKPDAITLDIMLPGMDGFHLLRALKQDRATAGIPVLIISLVGDPARGGLSLGAFSFLQKPLDHVRLAETIAAAMASARGDLPQPGQAYWARVLFVAGGSEAETEGIVADLAAQGIAAQAVRSAPEAVARIVTDAPDLVLVDMALSQEDVFSLMAALKAEEEAARIPMVLLTDDISDEGIHFHLGSDPMDNTVSLDYICEQLGRVRAAPQEALT